MRAGQLRAFHSQQFLSSSSVSGSTGTERTFPPPQIGRGELTADDDGERPKPWGERLCFLGVFFCHGMMQRREEQITHGNTTGV